MAAVPALLPTVHATAPRPPMPAVKRPARTSRRLVVFSMLVGGSAALLAWLKLRDTPRLPRQTTHIHPSSTPRPTTPLPTPSPPPPQAPAPPPTPPPTEPPGKSAPDAAEVKPPPAEDEEEALLEHSEPASGQILGEAEGERPATQPAKHGEQGKPKSDLPDSVSLHIETHPSGAVVKLKDRVFGKSPLNLRFRPGIIYELTFVKKGHQTASKRFTVTGRKNQKVTVTLKKKSPAKPAPKRSLFRRIFG